MKLVLKPTQDPKVEEKISKVFAKLLNEILPEKNTVEIKKDK